MRFSALSSHMSKKAWVVLLALPYVAAGGYFAYVQRVETPHLVLSSGAKGGVYVQAGEAMNDVLDGTIRLDVA